MTISQNAPSVLRMSAPLIVSFWMRAVVTFIDTIYAALIGDAAVAAIGLTLPFEFLMIAVWVGLSTGLTSALSRAMGARQGRQIEQYGRATWRLIWLMAPLFMVLGIAIWFASPHLSLGAEVGRNFQLYGTVLLVGSSLTTFWSVIPDSLVKAHQDTKTTMWAGIWTNAINVVLNTLFLFVFGWGIFGIALSTVIGRLGGLAYALVRARRHENRRKASGEFVREELDPSPYRTMLALAIPSSLTFALMAAETGLINWLLAGMEHATEAIAAYAIYYRFVLFALQPMIAIAVAMLPFAARRYGEGDILGMRRGFRDSVVASTIYSLVFVGPIMLLAAPWIADRLSESELTSDYAVFGLCPLACFTGTMFLLCRPVFEAMNQGRPGLVMAVLRYVVLTAPLAWGGMVLAERVGKPPLYGLLVGLLIAAALSSIAFYAWLRAAWPKQPT